MRGEEIPSRREIGQKESEALGQRAIDLLLPFLPLCLTYYSSPSLFFSTSLIYLFLFLFLSLSVSSVSLSSISIILLNSFTFYLCFSLPCPLSLSFSDYLCLFSLGVYIMFLCFFLFNCIYTLSLSLPTPHYLFYTFISSSFSVPLQRFSQAL